MVLNLHDSVKAGVTESSGSQETSLTIAPAWPSTFDAHNFIWREGRHWEDPVEEEKSTALWTELIYV